MMSAASVALLPDAPEGTYWHTIPPAWGKRTRTAVLMPSAEREEAALGLPQLPSPFPVHVVAPADSIWRFVPYAIWVIAANATKPPETVISANVCGRLRNVGTCCYKLIHQDPHPAPISR